MNRKYRRMRDKELRKKLTQEQYEDLRSKAQEEHAERKAYEIFSTLCEKLRKVMRDNKISEQRIEKIFTDFLEEIKGEKNEKLS
ncbi:hypothetical protein SAMN05661008_01507 [Alkalithermobacter thermoalcaliphilus JW-YL-7 = DSM 7308]|uniref:Uncharacterized protein n=1 Tax=Alkalithermobacter thermoalcaliphilus JW-YL-7 = DSM 7308 TaxID=1121328 RepID=A0A150FQZ7_CLOPD|nr:hypothetical protein JWYL7_1108 [[Clostridium] paradoxum JW-YL-7 = DSM 7308]SHL12915.1 hypothetical protein SAMN05661008_01507 [[Clostridium] paradoxum JW-YL-7 = DSM 7308]